MGDQCEVIRTDFDSLFITDEADQNALVAKQQQLSYISSRPGAGSGHISSRPGAGSGHITPQSRGSPARRQQVYQISQLMSYFLRDFFPINL